MSSWVTITDYRQAPQAPGVYVFMLDGKPYYVGQAVNLRVRIPAHIKPYAHLARRQFLHEHNLMARRCQTIKYKVGRRYGEWLMWEARLIKRLRPAGNEPTRRRWA